MNPKLCFLFVLAFAICFGRFTQARAATINVSGTIYGIEDIQNNDLSTLDYYWITVLEDAQITSSFFISSDPPAPAASLDLHFYFYPPQEPSDSDLEVAWAILGNNSETKVLSAGLYILAIDPGSSDFDGYLPLPAVENCSSIFDHTNYTLNVSGNIRLDEIWIGQYDGTFIKTIVPEPSSLCCLFLVFCLGLGRRIRPATLLPLLALTMVSEQPLFAQQQPMRVNSTPQELRNGVLCWPTLKGKEYRVQRGGELDGWVTLSERIYGTGNVQAFKAYDLPEFAQAVENPLPTGPQLPIYSFVAYPFTDGRCVVRMLHWWSYGEVIEMDLRLPNNPSLTYHDEVWVTVNDPATNQPAYKLDFWVLGFTAPDSNIDHPTPLNKPAHIDAMAKLKANKQAVINALATPVPYAPPGPPLITKKFDDKGRPLRQFFRVKERLVDSDGDGYSDYTEFLGGSNPQSFTSVPADADADGFSDAEEISAGTNPNLNTSHPAGGFLSPYLGLNGPVITEFMSDNTSSLDNTIIDSITNLPKKDHDWLELYNPTGATIVLDDFFLTDESGSSLNNRLQWRFPPGASIPPRSFAIVFLDDVSDYHRTNNPTSTDRGPDALGYFHTNFALAKTGDYLALTKWNHAPGDTTIDATELTTTSVCHLSGGRSFGTMLPDQSMGCYVDEDGVLKFGTLRRPTPQRHNSEGYASVLPQPPVSQTGHLREGGAVTVTLGPPVDGNGAPFPDGLILYTLNGALPTEYSDVCHSRTFTFEKSTVLRAMTVRKGYEKSPVRTENYLSKTSVIGTAAAGVLPTDAQGTPPNYPTQVPHPSYQIDYRMDPKVIQQRGHTPDTEPAPRPLPIKTALSSAPVVCITVPVEDLFDKNSGGIYGNSEYTYKVADIQGQHPNYTAVQLAPYYDPQGREWERRGHIQWLDPAHPNQPSYEFSQDCTVEISGAASRSSGMNAKLSLRLTFGADQTPGAAATADVPLTTNFAPFPNAPTLKTFHKLILRNPAQNAWGNRFEISAHQNYNNRATYVMDDWGRRIHQAMDLTDNPMLEHRWVHVYLNGIYWGVYGLSEHLDRKTLQTKLGGGKNWDVVKALLEQGYNTKWDASDGDLVEWNQLLTQAAVVGNPNSAAAAATAAWNQVLAVCDVENYVDYLLVNCFIANQDWPTNNYAMARERAVGKKWKFFAYDFDICCQDWAYTTGPSYISEVLHDVKSPNGNINQLFRSLEHYPAFKDLFKARVALAFATNGVFPPYVTPITNWRVYQDFSQAANQFRPLAYCESARWGASSINPPPPLAYTPKTTAFTYDEPSWQPGVIEVGDLKRRWQWIANNLLPIRRAHTLTGLKDLGLADAALP
jgi:hypothetical protein